MEVTYVNSYTLWWGNKIKLEKFGPTFLVEEETKKEESWSLWDGIQMGRLPSVEIIGAHSLWKSGHFF